MENVKVAVLIGTRPGIIKMTPLVHELRRRNQPHYVIHSGQHYSSKMDELIMRDVGLDHVKYHIRRPIDCVSHAQQTAYMLTNIEQVLQNDPPDILLVCGDANTNLSGALAARKLHVKVGHVEAGLRSFDWRMPEEHNRVIIDHISEYLFAPTYDSKRHLIADNVVGDIFVVGNTVVDSALNYSSNIPSHVADKVLAHTHGEPYMLMTMHREENVDDKVVLQRVLETIEKLSDSVKTRILFPLHPRTRKRLHEFDLFEEVSGYRNVVLIEPLGYVEFLAFLKGAILVMTDSGGIQEESCIVGTPCITLRDSTERPETIDVGANHVAGTLPENILSVFNSVWEARATRTPWAIPYGDGQASRRIIETCIYGKPADEVVA